MAKQEKFTYEDVFLSFDLNGKEITGTLKGSYKLWHFQSMSPAFIKVYPNGVISSGMLYLELREEHHAIYNGIIDAAEAMGYSFEPKG